MGFDSPYFHFFLFPFQEPYSKCSSFSASSSASKGDQSSNRCFHVPSYWCKLWPVIRSVPITSFVNHACFPDLGRKAAHVLSCLNITCSSMPTSRFPHDLHVTSQRSVKVFLHRASKFVCPDRANDVFVKGV